MGRRGATEASRQVCTAGWSCAHGFTTVDAMNRNAHVCVLEFIGHAVADRFWLAQIQISACESDKQKKSRSCIANTFQFPCAGALSTKSLLQARSLETIPAGTVSKNGSLICIILIRP